VVALIAGWVTTEVGRQPWVVYGVMRTEEAVTGAEGIVFGYGALVAVYVVLATATFWVLRKLARTPFSEEIAAMEVGPPPIEPEPSDRKGGEDGPG